MADIEAYEKIGTMGRKRKYEKVGINEALSVRDVILFRVKMGRYPPDVSDDMRDRFDFFYLTKPNRKVEQAKDAREYERHVKAYNRARKWLGAVGHSNITDITKRLRSS